MKKLIIAASLVALDFKDPVEFRLVKRSMAHDLLCTTGARAFGRRSARGETAVIVE